MAVDDDDASTAPSIVQPEPPSPLARYTGCPFNALICRDCGVSVGKNTSLRTIRQLVARHELKKHKDNPLSMAGRETAGDFITHMLTRVAAGHARIARIGDRQGGLVSRRILLAAGEHDAEATVHQLRSMDAPEQLLLQSLRSCLTPVLLFLLQESATTIKSRAAGVEQIKAVTTTTASITTSSARRTRPRCYSRNDQTTRRVLDFVLSSSYVARTLAECRRRLRRALLVSHIRRALSCSRGRLKSKRVVPTSSPSAARRSAQRRRRSHERVCTSTTIEQR
jgi:organic hydroperoxide reductase OsmC/OhrA